jgi:hypothetical protein
MNIDADGEPQAYAPLARHDLKARDNLGNAGWKSETGNAKLKAEWEALIKELEDLDQQKAAAASKDIDAKIAHVKRKLKNYFWAEKESDRPVNYGRIFWHWYGVTGLKDEKASWTDPKLKIVRHPELDKSSIYEDVHGKYPVVQSKYEPGPGYFVSPVPMANKAYPEWDQRHFLPASQLTQGPYGALSTGLKGVSGVRLGDTLFALRLDNGKTLAFPYRDSGNGAKLAECGYEAFAALGGKLEQNVNKSRNDFLLLYLAFPKRQTPEAALAKFATATNADDFPAMLAFLAQATIKAPGGGKKKVAGDPLHAYQQWKANGTPALPSIHDTIESALSDNGFTPAAQRVVRNQPAATKRS